jgi:ferrous-iron efflux pump FieF
MINVAPLKPAERERLLKLATYASVAVAVLLIALKSSVYLMSGSVSLLASLIDSLMDAAASVINLFAVRYALKPADHEHRFGHGKAEALAGLAQSAFITGSAVLVLLQGIDRILNPRPFGQRLAGHCCHAVFHRGDHRSAVDSTPCHQPHRLHRNSC